MNAIRIAILFASMLASGCIPKPRDISDEPGVRALGVIGGCYRLKVALPLMEIGRPTPRLVTGVPPCQVHAGGPGTSAGVLAAGTRIVVFRAERLVNYYDGLFTGTANHLIARVKDGDHRGKVFDLSGVYGTISVPDPAKYEHCE